MPQCPHQLGRSASYEHHPGRKELENLPACARLQGGAWAWSCLHSLRFLSFLFTPPSLFLPFSGGSAGEEHCLCGAKEQRPSVERLERRRNVKTRKGFFFVRRPMWQWMGAPQCGPCQREGWWWWRWRRSVRLPPLRPRKARGKRSGPGRTCGMSTPFREKRAGQGHAEATENVYNNI